MATLGVGNPEGDRSPELLRRGSNNGPEFTAYAIQDWLEKASIKTIYSTPGSPWENGHIESFYGKLRDECLDRELFGRLFEMLGHSVAGNSRFQHRDHVHPPNRPRRVDCHALPRAKCQHLFVKTLTLRAGTRNPVKPRASRQPQRTAGCRFASQAAFHTLPGSPPSCSRLLGPLSRSR
jgi:hypothetical protein